MKTAALYTISSFYILVLFFFMSVVLIYLSPKRWHTLLTVFLGLVTAFIDAQSSEVSFSILLLLAFGFFLGFTKMGVSLRTGFLLAVWLPLIVIVHSAFLGKYSVFLSEGFGSLIAFIPAIGGSCLGDFKRSHSGDSLPTRDALI